MFGKLALLLVVLGAANAAFVNTGKGVADVDFLNKQKRIFELLLFVGQDNLNDMEFYDIGRNFDFENSIEMFSEKDTVKEFVQWYRFGMLPKNALFSPYVESHVDEMKLLYKIFVQAKDFNTFYKTACWARMNMNVGVFTSAFTVAVFQREDCKFMRLPAFYEIFPSMFFDNGVIQEAHKIKMMKGFGTTTSGIGNLETYMIYANTTGEYYPFYENPEYQLSYFTEDPSLNTFYYYFRQIFPYWLGAKESKIPEDLRGNFYFFFHQQLLARYNLERISNGMKGIGHFDWFDKFEPGFFSNLVYTNGMSMPQRNMNSEIYGYRYKMLKEIDTLELRLLNAIDAGFIYEKTGKMVNIYTEEGLNLLGNLIEGNVDSCNRRFYGMYDALARDILGYGFGYDKRAKVVPGALQCYSTSMRDPAFYRIYRKIMTYFYRYKKYAPYYKQSELLFPGIKIDSVTIDKLATYTDQCEYFINNAVFVENFKEGMQMRIKAKRDCLNSKPFTFKLNVNSDKETQAVLRVFIGPTFGDNELDLELLNKYYMYFVEMDKFIVNLRQGQNTIERRSTDFEFTAPEILPADEIYKKLTKAIGGSEPFHYQEKYFGFPQRLVLPRGSLEGMKFRMFFFLSPYDQTVQLKDIQLPIFGKFYLDGKPFGFPFDRPMYTWKFLQDNMLFKDVMIYHLEGMQQMKTMF